jgi:hypothetical protein
MANLADIPLQTRYVRKGLEVYKQWSTLVPNQRARVITDELNSILTNNLQIPALKTNMGENLGDTTCGQLDFSTWTIQLNFRLWSRRSISLDQMREFCETIYHETRHAEQWYRVGQGVAAGQFVPRGMGTVHRFGPSAHQIALALGLEPAIAKDMEQKKRFFNVHVPAPMVPLVRTWFVSIYGTGADERNRVLASNTHADFINYRHLPEEADAHKVEQSVRAIWKQNEPDEGQFEGVADLFKPEAVHYQEWISKTSRNLLHFRSSELNTVDRALQSFDANQTPVNRQNLKLAFDRWYEHNQKERDKRNQDNCVQRLKSFLEEAA